MNNNKGRVYILAGNSLMALAGGVFVWFVWITWLQPIWLQNQQINQFQVVTTATPFAATPTPMPTATALATPTPVPLPTPTEVNKENYLLEIPSIKFKWVIHHITPGEVSEDPWGIRKYILDKYGVVDYPHLKYPGESGLVAIAGHSDISGNPFWNLSKVKVGDQIFITRKDGVEITYIVYRALEVDPSDPVFWEMKYPNELRVVSCLVGSTRQRVMVFAYQL